MEEELEIKSSSGINADPNKPGKPRGGFAALWLRGDGTLRVGGRVSEEEAAEEDPPGRVKARGQRH